MMDPLVVVSKLQKMMRDSLQRVGDSMISGGVDNMEKYQYLLQEISNLLEEKEQKNEHGKVIDINEGSSKT